TGDLHNDILPEGAAVAFGRSGKIQRLTPRTGHALLEDLPGAVVGARDGQGDRLIRQGAVDLVPVPVGVVHEFTVDRNLGGDREEDVLGFEREIAAIDVHGKNDAVIAELDLADVGDAVHRAGLDLAFLD